MDMKKVCVIAAREIAPRYGYGVKCQRVCSKTSWNLKRYFFWRNASEFEADVGSGAFQVLWGENDFFKPVKRNESLSVDVKVRE